MNPVYFDTNIFIYLSQKRSPFYFSAMKLVAFLKRKRYSIVTSTETVQEIIHVSQNSKQIVLGVKIARKTLEILDDLFPVNREVVKIYLDLVNRYRNIKSRDSLHVAVCLNQAVEAIITHDADFKKFKEIHSITPKEFLERYISSF